MDLPGVRGQQSSAVLPICGVPGSNEPKEGAAEAHAVNDFSIMPLGLKGTGDIASQEPGISRAARSPAWTSRATHLLLLVHFHSKSQGSHHDDVE